MSAGIDYGRGMTNINHETGIRFGCISQHSVSQAWSDNAEPDYGEPTCPKCGNEVESTTFEPDSMGNRSGNGEEDLDLDAYESYRKHGCADYVCESCEITLDSEDCFSDEPIRWSYSENGYELADCLDSDIIVIKSDFYTFAPFCSPCVPGAGHLDSASENGVKTYCLGHDWFEEGKAPYRIWRVSDDSEVLPRLDLT